MMKKGFKFALCIFVLCFFVLNCYAKTNATIQQQEVIVLQPQEQSQGQLLEVIAEAPKNQASDNGFIQVKPAEVPKPLPPVSIQVEQNIFNRNFEKTFDEGIIKDASLILGHDAMFNGFVPNAGHAHNTINNQVSLYGVKGHFRDGTIYNFSFAPFYDYPQYSNFEHRLFEYYVKRPIDKHHQLTVGQQRVPTTLDGCSSIFRLSTGRRSQFGNKYNNITSIGAKVSGDWDRVEYQAGVFDTGRFLKDTFNSAPEFASLVSFKPIRNTQKYGKLKTGGSYTVGQRETSYSVYSGHAIYDYKKAHVDFEYAYANGYNGRFLSAAKSYGYYSTFMYDITPKVKAFYRFDTLNTNKSLAGKTTTEYTFGMHYYIKGNKARFTLSYIYANNQSTPDSNRFFSMLELLL